MVQHITNSGKMEEEIEEHHAKLTSYLVDLWVEHKLHEVIIGYNKKWK